MTKIECAFIAAWLASLAVAAKKPRLAQRRFAELVLLASDGAAYPVVSFGVPLAPPLCTITRGPGSGE